MIIWIDQLAEAGLDSPGDPTLSLVYTDIMEEIAYFMDFGRKASVAAGLTVKQERAVSVYRKQGYRNFLNAFDWQFLRPTISKTIWASTTGTTSGTPSYDGESGSIVTATASKFFDTMVGGTFTFDTSSTEYTVTGYQSATVIEVSGDASGEAAGDTFTMTPDGANRLPGNFGGIIGEVTFQANEGFYMPLEIRSELQIRKLLQTSTDAGRPMWAATRPATSDGAKGQRYDLLTYPIADTNYTVSIKYNIMPDDFSATDEFPYGGMSHTETIKAACIAAAEVGTREQRGVRWEEYQSRLQESIRRERYAYAPDSLGYNGDSSDFGSSNAFQRTKIVTVGGLSFP